MWICVRYSLQLEWNEPFVTYRSYLSTVKMHEVVSFQLCFIFFPEIRYQFRNFFSTSCLVR